MCNEAFSFTTNGKVMISNITVSGTTLVCTVSNNKSAEQHENIIVHRIK